MLLNRQVCELTLTITSWLGSASIRGLEGVEAAVFACLRVEADALVMVVEGRCFSEGVLSSLADT